MKPVLSIIIVFLPYLVKAQSFSEGMTRTLSTSDITPSAFHFIVAGTAKQTLPDPNLPFVQLHEIIREDGKIYHLLFQEDLTGKTVVLGIDRDLLPVFQCEKNRLIPLNHCIIKKLEDPWILNKTEVYIECILDRLNQCY